MDIVYLLGKEPLFCVDFLTDCKEVFLVMRGTYKAMFGFAFEFILQYFIFVQIISGLV